MKNLLFLCACLLALATPLRAAVAPPADIVVVRIYYHLGSPINAVVTRAEGKSEILDLKHRYPTTFGRADEQLTQDNEAYYKICHQFYQEGYVLQSTVNTPSNNYDGYTILFFVKA